MSRKEALVRLQTRLVAQRENLRRKIHEDMGLVFSPDDGINDIGEQANQVEQSEIYTQLAALESRELEQIEHAIVQIQRGTFGQCTRCEKAIPIARLEVLPFTEFCVDCQRKAETRGRGGSGDYSENWRSAYEFERRSNVQDLSLSDLHYD